MSKYNKTLEQWVDYIQTLHFRDIELGLDRVETVYRCLYPNGMACKVISVAGTNGKGSTSELLSSIYQHSGYNVGKFTSPHLIDFGERYCINGNNATEDEMLAAFERIEAVRGDVPITFFEFGTLLAIELFSVAKVDVAIMEVGLGGRLDAVNILDADVAIITSISIDHIAWLGDTVDVIAREKAGIARPHKPCVVGIADTPSSIIDHCKKINAPLHIIERDFNYQCCETMKVTWEWRSNESEFVDLPLPFRQQGVQLSNASLAIRAIELLSSDLAVNGDGIREGLKHASILARCHVLSDEPLVVLDVAHNESSVSRLREFVEQQKLNTSASLEQGNDEKDTAKTVAVCGMLKDKEIAKSLAVLNPIIDQWFFADIDHERGATAVELHQQLTSLQDDLSNVNHQKVSCSTKITDAYQLAFKQLNEYDTLIVFGSFFVAGDILQINVQ